LGIERGDLLLGGKGEGKTLWGKTQLPGGTSVIVNKIWCKPRDSFRDYKKLISGAREKGKEKKRGGPRSDWRLTEGAGGHCLTSV